MRVARLLVKHRVVRTALATAGSVGLGLAGRVALGWALGTRAPYGAFVPCVVLATIAGGGWAGLASLVVFLTVGAWQLEPTTLVPTRTPVIGLIMFGVGGLGLVMLTVWTNRQRARIRHSSAVLREREHRYKVLAETVPDFVWSCAPDGRVEYLNPQYVGYTGVTLATVNEGGWHATVHPEDHAAVEAAWGKTLSEGCAFELEYRFRRKSDGAYRWFLTRTVPVRDERGRIVRWVGAATDIHEAKMAREERERLLAAERTAREEAERAGRVKDQFLAVLSHELRTPLTPVLLTVSLLESNPDLPGAVREDVASIRRNIELEARLIDDLLDLTRIARGKIQYDFQAVDLHILIRSAISICCGDEKLHIQTRFDAERTFVSGDPARLQQVFCNLLNNAWKFTPAGGTVSIRTLGVEEGWIVAEVSDTGAGIDPEVLPRIFDAFEQGDAVRARKFGGLGLGLAICRALVEAHQGKIAAISQGVGKGATFRVELPTVAEPAPVQRGPSPPPEVGQRLRMLVVEDHPFTLGALEKLLRAIGHEVDGVGTVAEGLRKAGSGGYDLVISDLGLPDGSGYDLMRQLRDAHGLRGIALSGYGMEEDVTRSREAGFLDHLVKPVDVNKLEAAIARAWAGTGEKRVVSGVEGGGILRGGERDGSESQADRCSSPRENRSGQAHDAGTAAGGGGRAV